MKIKRYIISLLFFHLFLYPTEHKEVLTYYSEFLTTIGIINKLHTLVNKTAIDVKSATTIKDDESIFLQCDSNYNTTNQGLIAYFEEDHITQVYSPFGTIMIFWRTEKDTQWDAVTREFRKTCILDQDSFKQKSSKYKHAYPILKYGDTQVKNPTQLVQGNQDRKEILNACIKKFIEDKGIVTKLDSLTKRKEALNKLHPPLSKTIGDIATLELLFRMFDISN